MNKIIYQQNYKIKAGNELKKQLNEKIAEKIRFFLWYIAEEAKPYGLNLEILANISETGKVFLFFTDKNTGAMFDCNAFPLALSVVPSFKCNEMGEITKIERIEINPRDVENWTDYFKTFRDVEGRTSFLPKARGVC